MAVAALRLVHLFRAPSLLSFLGRGCATGALLVLTGCVHTPKIAEVAKPAVLPAAFIFDHPAVPADIGGAWWQRFGSQELDTTVRQILAGNLTLASARARWEQLDAVRERARGLRRPQLSGAIGWDRDLDRDPRRADGLQAEVGMDVTVDIFDRLGALARQREWEWVAQEERLAAARLAVSAAAVELYYGVVAQRQLLALLRNQEATAREVLALIERRFAEGLISRLDVLQQQGQVAEIATLVPAAEKALNDLLIELAVLAGQPSGAFGSLAQASRFANIEPMFLPQQPIDLLQTRPDLRAAQADLRAIDADLSRAVAERWPRLTFSGSMLWLNGRDLNGSPVTTLAADLVQPLLDWGGRKLEVTRVEAVKRERLMNFSQAFLRAVAELEAAVLSEQKQRELITLLDDRGRILRETLRQANRRYDSGLTDYLSVLSVTQQLHSLEQRMVRENRVLMSLRVAQFVSMGGPMPDAPEAASTGAGRQFHAREGVDAIDQFAE